MIIVKFSGALGNQLFQFALYRKLRYLNQMVKADIRVFENGLEKRKFYLPLLDICLDEVRGSELKRYAQSFSKLEKISINLKLKRPYYEDNPVYCFQPEILKMESVYLSGYWQSEKYFKDIRNILLSEIKFPDFTSDSNIRLQKNIISTNAVSIHIRMGDYLTHSHEYGNICTKEYYRKAVVYIKQQVANPVFYVFSDDIPKAKELLENTEFVWVNGNSEENAYQDMHLMSLCNHNIIANSSFSWWGAWLNQNHEKIVIAPKRWLNTKEVKDIWGQEWVKI